MGSEAYGRGLGERFRLETPALVTQALQNTQIAVSRIKCDLENHGLTAPFPYEDAYLVALQIREVPDHELWVDGKPVPKLPFEAGVTSIYDLKRNPIAYLRSPSHSLMFYLPRRALNAIADNDHAKRIEDFAYAPGVGIHDPVMLNLAMTLLPAFEAPEQASRLFIEHVTLAVGVHLSRTYGGMTPNSVVARGGLAPWQEKRAKELIEASVDGDLPLAQLAAECQLSTSHFSRAFRQTTGRAPYQWLLEQRIAKAKDLLQSSQLPLAELAQVCGFADQSHLTRVFKQRVGASPGAWRRDKSG
ncbi:helix-turn-helix transcriptional regulator [Bradyrhizobium sp. Arg62]|uniref:AraC family transcriptional regulator n=1 Tax=Bradyrhizobium brasilense TaxID=1419277 RepID=UPI001E434DE7|nr:AraC family transcriptional regulator [Bradyrhizobium brasilense]MCC8943556.1 helix-turn-helix transcriptional regulator [Bradyrhizobium brasilense]